MQITESCRCGATIHLSGQSLVKITAALINWRHEHLCHDDRNGSR